MRFSDRQDSRVTSIHLGKYFPPDIGGMETYLRDLMVASLAMKTRSVALVHQSKPWVKSTDEEYQIDDERLSITRVASWGRFLFTPISPTFPLALRQLIRRHQPDLLHLHLPNPSAIWALLVPSARRLPWVIQWQSDTLTPKSSWLLRMCYVLYKPFESAILRRAERIIVTSPQYLQTSRALLPFKTGCRIIPLGIKDRFGKTRPGGEDTINEGPLQILAIGRLTHYKGFDILLEAITKTSNAELDLVGSGEQLSYLKSLSKSLGIEKRIRFHGMVSDATRDSLLRSCDCVCLPSIDRTESFGIVLLEAMSAGKPCVISEVPGSGMTSLVEPGRSGILVPPEDSSALAEAFAQFITSRRLLIEMGTRGRKKFERDLTIEASARSVVALYNEINTAKADLSNSPTKYT